MELPCDLLNRYCVLLLYCSYPCTVSPGLECNFTVMAYFFFLPSHRTSSAADALLFISFYWLLNNESLWVTKKVLQVINIEKQKQKTLSQIFLIKASQKFKLVLQLNLGQNWQATEATIHKLWELPARHPFSHFLLLIELPFFDQASVCPSPRGHRGWWPNLKARSKSWLILSQSW